MSQFEPSTLWLDIPIPLALALGFAIGMGVGVFLLMTLMEWARANGQSRESCI